jgi:isopentenyl phosphate kinase
MDGMTSGGVVVKLGGSVVTDKRAEEPRVRREVVSRLAREIADAAPRPLVLVHGAGSFGHQIVRRTRLHEGLHGPRSLLDWGETQRLQYDLDSEVAGLMLAEGLPVVPCQASATAVMRAGTLVSMDLGAVRLMVEHGAVPLLYGVPAVDLDQGCSILSGDQIAPYVASGLGIDRLVHATDVDGVFEEDPGLSPAAQRFDRIDAASWPEVRRRLGGSKAIDVTGGMAGKVEALLNAARGGLEVRIVDANVPGRLASALRGEAVGTLVLWGHP